MTGMVNLCQIFNICQIIENINRPSCKSQSWCTLQLVIFIQIREKHFKKIIKKIQFYNSLQEHLSIQNSIILRCINHKILLTLSTTVMKVSRTEKII